MYAFLIKSINALIRGLGSVLGLFLGILPNSPFQAIDNSVVKPYLNGFNYFIPVSEILAIGQAWLSAIAVYYISQVVLRWIKAIK